MWEKPYIFPLSNPAFVQHSPEFEVRSKLIFALLFHFLPLKKGIDLNFATSVQKWETVCRKKDVSEAAEKCE